MYSSWVSFLDMYILMYPWGLLQEILFEAKVAKWSYSKALEASMLKMEWSPSVSSQVAVCQCNEIMRETEAGPASTTRTPVASKVQSSFW